MVLALGAAAAAAARPRAAGAGAACTGRGAGRRPARQRREPRKPTTSEVSAAKAKLKTVCAEAPFRSGIFSADELCEEIEAAAVQLERLDTCVNPATTGAQVLDGDWEVLYSDADSLPAGLLGPFVGEVTQTLDLVARQDDLHRPRPPGGPSRHYRKERTRHEYLRACQEEVTRGAGGPIHQTFAYH